MNITIFPQRIEGEFNVLSSKSDVIRILICSLFSKENINLKMNNFCDDIKFGIGAIKSLGKKVNIKDNIINISTLYENIDYAEVDCGESGTLLRFLLPCANYFANKVRFKGKKGLTKRPIKELIELLSKHGLLFSGYELPFEVEGELKSGTYFISGNISSQYISGLLFILPLLDGNSKIIITSKLESEKYVDMTVNRLNDFGIHVKKYNNEIFIKGNQNYNPQKCYTAEGDWSYGASLLCLGAVNGDIKLSGLNMKSVQPDRCILDILSEMEADVKYNDECVRVKSNLLRGIERNLSGCPDLFPVIAATASFAEDNSIFYGINRLIYKESNRLESTSKVLEKLGANLKYDENKAIIYPNKKLYDGDIYTFNDHRIAMAASIMGLKSLTPVKIIGAECVNKSAPAFFDCFKEYIKEE